MKMKIKDADSRKQEGIDFARLLLCSTTVSSTRKGSFYIVPVCPSSDKFDP
jgi:hypothetical protein